MSGKQQFALHGYLPVRVGEWLLSDHEKRTAFEQGMGSILDIEQKAAWDQLLSEDELSEREELRAEFKRNSAGRVIGDARPLPDEFRFCRIGMLRQFALDKYGNGQPVVYGDRCLVVIGR